MKKKNEEYKFAKKNLAIGVAGGFVAGGTLLSYQFLLMYGYCWAFLGAIITGSVIWKIAIRMIEREIFRKP